MKQLRSILTITLFGLSFTLSGQASISAVSTINYRPKTTTIFYRLGETNIPLKIQEYGDSRDIVYINLHSDEKSSLHAATQLLQKEGGLLIRIENMGKRNIRFKLKGVYYSFDPNRIFSREGVTQTLRQLGRINNNAIDEVEKFGKRILELMPEKPKCIVALHNNTDGKFGIMSYRVGADRQRDAVKIYEDIHQDPDDIFLTTDSVLYHRLAGEKFNTILQDNVNVKRDGSLSVYCGERDITYLNCETEHGRTSQYLTMLISAVTHIQELHKGGLKFSFELDPDAVSLLKENDGIYFGEKRIGQVNIVKIDSTQISGEMVFETFFPIYSNMDLFLTSGEDARLELRVDPTRERLLLQSGSVVLPVKALK